MLESSNSGKKNLWHDLLDSVGKRQDLRQAHLLVLGDRGAGKRSFINSMNKPFLKQLGLLLSKMEEFCSDYGHFDCSYLYVRDLADADQET